MQSLAHVDDEFLNPAHREEVLPRPIGLETLETTQFGDDGVVVIKFSGNEVDDIDDVFLQEHLCDFLERNRVCLGKEKIGEDEWRDVKMFYTQKALHADMSQNVESHNFYRE